MKRLLAAVCTLLLAASPLAVHAQEYPIRPIKIIVSYGPGGTADILARMVGNHLSKVTGQPVVVENKAGANGQLGYDFASKSSPDGYTLFLGNSTLLAVGVTLYPEKQYDPPNEFISIGGLASGPLVVIVNPSVPAQAMAEFLTYAKNNPGRVNAGLSGWGSMHHLVTETIRSSREIQWTQVAYKDSAQLVRDVVAGVVDFGVDNIPSSLGQIQAGKLRAIAVTGAKRTLLLPEVPTLSEAGVPGIEATSWFGLVAPAGTPRYVAERLNPEINLFLQEAETIKRLAALGLDPIPGPSRLFHDLVISENVRWAKVIKQAGIKVDK